MATQTCGISVPWPEIELMSPTLEAQNPNHWTAREVSIFMFILLKILAVESLQRVWISLRLTKSMLKKGYHKYALIIKYLNMCVSSHLQHIWIIHKLDNDLWLLHEILCRSMYLHSLFIFLLLNAWNHVLCPAKKCLLIFLFLLVWNEYIQAIDLPVS